MHDAIALEYGADSPLVLEPEPGGLVMDLAGPEGVADDEARRLVSAAVAAPPHGPPLAAHVVPGDHVVVALAGAVPQADVVVAVLRERLVASGVAPEDVQVLRGAGLESTAAVALAGGGSPSATESAGGGANAIGSVVSFDPTDDTATAYLAADDEGQPLYMARALVDADVVVAVGGWGWDAAVGGRSPEGELWPTFSRLECRRRFDVALARRGRQALPDWRSGAWEATWQLGICASLRLVAGRRDTLHAACFGLPDEAARQARQAADAWRPSIDEPVALTVATLSRPAGSFRAVTRAVAAAARVTHPAGTICIASRVATGPGVVFLRWRQGAPLRRLVHEAVTSGDPTLVADAIETRLFARALGERRLVLLSEIPETEIEELGFGCASGPEAIERLFQHAESVAVLHEADRMLPRLG
jgi:hypothetical protein